jgi:hypothetical protein
MTKEKLLDRPIAYRWRRWRRDEAVRQGQLEFELPMRSTDTRRAEARQSTATEKRRRKRWCKQPGVYLP